MKTKKKYDFIYIGRLSSEKNYQLIFDIAIKIKNSKILIISNDINNYNKNIKNIIYKKNISNDKIHEYLLKSKFLVLPSNYEGQSKVMLESMYFNIPVIAKILKVLTNISSIIRMVSYLKILMILLKLINLLMRIKSY